MFWIVDHHALRKSPSKYILNQFDFNKYNADNFVHDMWQK